MVDFSLYKMPISNKSDAAIISASVANNTNITQTKTTSSYTADTTDIKVINAIGDGNCFFRCISVYFNDTQTHHETINQQVVNKMQSDSNKYKQFVSGSFNKHLEDMCKKNGNALPYATEAEIIAASDLQPWKAQERLWTVSNFFRRMSNAHEWC
jgi:hypothetical protein